MTDKLLAQSLYIPWGQDGGETRIKGLLEGGSWGMGGGENFTLGSIISRSMDYIFIFAGVGLLLMLLGGGFTFLTSAGDSKKLEQGKQQLTNALLGFTIIFISFWLVQALGFMFGLDAVQNIFQ